MKNASIGVYGVGRGEERRVGRRVGAEECWDDEVVDVLWERWLYRTCTSRDTPRGSRERERDGRIKEPFAANSVRAERPRPTQRLLSIRLSAVEVHEREP